MVSDFYKEANVKATTVEEKIDFGVQWYSGDSGVSDEELEAYLRDLVETAAREATAPDW